MPKSYKPPAKRPNIRQRWKTLSPKKRKAILVLLASLFITSYFLGLYAGKSLSPDYDTVASARSFIAANLRASFVGGDVLLTVTAGLDKYTYRLSTNSVSIELPSPNIAATIKAPRRNMLKEHQRLLELAGIAAAPAGVAGVWTQISNVTNKVTAAERTALYVTAGVATFTGAGLGFYIGYEDKADYHAPNFQKGLNDPQSWRSYAEILENCQMVAEDLRVLKETQLDVPDLTPSVKKDFTTCQQWLDWASPR